MKDEAKAKVEAMLRPAPPNLVLWFDLLDSTLCYSSPTSAQQPAEAKAKERKGFLFDLAFEHMGAFNATIQNVTLLYRSYARRSSGKYVVADLQPKKP